MSDELKKECSCNHDEDHECDCEEGYTIDLEDENGNVISCPIIDEFEYEGKEYYLAQNVEDESVYMFKLIGEELVVPEEEEFDKVSTYYNEVLVEKQ